MVPSCWFGRRQWGVRLKGSQQAQQSIQLDWLYQVMSESTLPTALTELGVPPAGECDKGDVPGVRQTPDLLGDLVSVHPRHAEVEQDDRGMEDGEGLEGRGAVVRDLHMHPAEPEQHSKAVGGIPVVVNHHDPVY
jgi:hypothetical protein